MSADQACIRGAEGPELAALIPQMRAFARSLCGERAQAEDLAQDALASAWQHRGAYEPGTNLKAWVFKILRNRFYSEGRSAWRTSQLDSALAEETLVAVSNADATLELDDVRRAMLTLPRQQREALTLIGVAGLSYEEAAAVCSCAVGTIKSRVNRARLQLSSRLSDQTPLGGEPVAGGAMAWLVASAEHLRMWRPASTQLAPCAGRRLGAAVRHPGGPNCGVIIA
jgi:RNA polymerase sigma-70 factor (ECF subfamily)